MIKKGILPHIRIFLLSIFFWAGLFCNSLWAQLYSYVDPEGVRHFTNVPTNPNYKPFDLELLNEWSTYLTDRYDHLIYRASKLSGVSFHLLKAVIKAESNFNPKAVSKKGAMGLMQIMPENLRCFNISNPFDPWENIRGGSNYLKKMLARFDGEVSLALAAYNAGPGSVDQYNDIPPYPETRNYIKRVMKYYRIIKDQ